MKGYYTILKQKIEILRHFQWCRNIYLFFYYVFNFFDDESVIFYNKSDDCVFTSISCFFLLSLFVEHFFSFTKYILHSRLPLTKFLSDNLIKATFKIKLITGGCNKWIVEKIHVRAILEEKDAVYWMKHYTAMQKKFAINKTVKFTLYF